jgi:cytochrome c biogenesis protein CcmG, thiol:disulfide interchange protein DsbE
MSEPIPTDQSHESGDAGSDSAIDRSVSVSNAPTTKSASNGRGKIVVVAVAAVAGALAFSVLTSKKSPSTSTNPAATTTAKPGSSVSATTAAEVATGLQAPPAETQLVKVTGEVLPNFTDGEDTAIGRPAPMLEGSGFDGKQMKIDPADGKAKVIFFVAHWCPHCQREVPLLAQWQKEGKLPTNLAYYTVSTAVDSKSANYPPSAWLTKDKWPFPVLADDKASTAVKSFGFGGFPFFVVVRADGTIGGRASGEKELEEVLAIFAKAG